MEEKDGHRKKRRKELNVKQREREVGMERKTVVAEAEGHGKKRKEA